uniref:LITAF domain-containing protein n=2 Tax=Cuerna arida TaxID=1464854 RepID=A0A1B6FPR6_9HEMI
MASNNMENPPPYSEAIKQPPYNPTHGGPAPKYDGAYQQSQPQYPPPGPSINVTRTVIVMPTYGPFPARTICTSCHADITTRVEHKPNTHTHLMALLLLFLFWPCALCPYCTDACQDTNHYCPNCGAFLGTHRET